MTVNITLARARGSSILGRTRSASSTYGELTKPSPMRIRVRAAAPYRATSSAPDVPIRQFSQRFKPPISGRAFTEDGREREPVQRFGVVVGRQLLPREQTRRRSPTPRKGQAGRRRLPSTAATLDRNGWDLANRGLARRMISAASRYSPFLSATSASVRSTTGGVSGMPLEAALRISIRIQFDRCEQAVNTPRSRAVCAISWSPKRSISSAAQSHRSDSRQFSTAALARPRPLELS